MDEEKDTPSPPKGKTAWARVMEDHPVFDRPWYLPHFPRLPTLKEALPTFLAWGNKLAGKFRRPK